MKTRILLIALFIQCVLTASFAQTGTLNDTVTFSTDSPQNMWGAGGAFSLDMEVDLFNESWNESFGPVGGIADFSDFYGLDFGQWGAQLSAGTWGEIGAKFYIRDVTAGEIEVNYPVVTTITYPDNTVIDRGEWVTINTAYALQNGWDLSTLYPDSGEAGLELNVNFNLYFHPEICIYDCFGVPIDININETFDVFKISADEVIYPGSTQSYTYDCPAPGSGYCYDPIDCISNNYCLPAWIRDTTLQPVEVSNDYLGMTGELSLPNVVTTDNVFNGTCLRAFGVSEDYVDLDFDILKFASNFVPPPAGTVLGNLSNSYSWGPATIEYNLFSMGFEVTNSNVQEFTFCPDIKTNFHFPSPVNYEERDASNNLIASGQSQDITVITGNDLKIEYPCNYEFIDVDVDYDLTNEFTNHTYDSISVSFFAEALGFKLEMEEQNIFSGLYLPEVCCCGGCLPWPCSCCWSDICVGGYYLIPPLTIPGFTFEPSPNPLISWELPLADIKYDWFNDSWELGGFTNQDGGTFQLDAKPYYASSTGTDVLCKGESNGTLTATITNGNVPYTYIWPDGTTTNTSSTSATNSNLPAGPNYVMIEDVNGCQAFTTYFIDEPLKDLDIIDAVVTDVDCNGNSTGSITVTVDGGNAGYVYTWSPNVGSTNSVTNLSAGTYDLTVTDAKGCSVSSSYTIEEPSALTATASVLSNVDCNGGDNGAAEVYANGGTFPYTYAWTNSDVTAIADSLTAGTYSTIVTDDNGCTTTVTNVIINEPTQALLLSVTQLAVDCYGASTGSIDLTTTGGTSPYQYNWYNENNIQLSQHTEDLSNMEAGTYTVFVTDDKNCKEEISIQVTQPDELLISNYSITDVNCFGDATGAIDLSVIGGTPTITFAWSNGDVTEDVTNLTAGDYTVYVTDGNGCTTSGAYTINEPSEPLSASSVNTDVLCFGGNNGAIDLSVQGGTAPYSYVWSNGETTQDIDTLLASNYDVTITDDLGCTLIYNTTINEPAAPLVLTNNVANLSCYQSQDGTLEALVSGGTTPYYYSWNNSENVYLSDTTAYIDDLSADTYTVQVVDANGCEISGDFIVTQPDEIELTAQVVDVLCYGESTGSIDVTMIGGTSPYTFSWSTGQTTEDLFSVHAGEYTLTATDDHGCSKDLIITVAQPESALSVSVESKDVLCYGESTAWAAVIAEGGVEPYTYLWSNGDTNDTTENIVAGVYTVTVTDAHACTANSGTVINQPSAALNFGVVVVDASCFNYSDGTITLNPLDGVSPYTLSFGDTLLNSYENLTNEYGIDGLHAGTYYAQIKDANGCLYEEYITVGEPDTLTIDGVVTDALCFGSADGQVDITVLGGTTPYAYDWSNGETVEDLAAVESGWYKIIVTDNQLCQTEQVYFVGQPSDINIKSTTTDPTCRDNKDGSITLYVSGGTPGYSYLWSNDEVTESIFDLEPGLYTIEVMDNNSCVKYDTININQSEIDCIQPPTAFTPDGDGINDTWYLPNMELYPNSTVQIYNKWGNLLYESTGLYEPWDGTYNGQKLPAATYYYIIDLNNGYAPYSGPVTIVIKE